MARQSECETGSPGPWTARVIRSFGEARPMHFPKKSSVRRLVQRASLPAGRRTEVGSNFGRGGGITPEQPEDAPRPPLFLRRPGFPKTMADRQGGFRVTHNPGLKPWAVLHSRFAAKVGYVPQETVLKSCKQSNWFPPGLRRPQPSRYLHSVPPAQNRNLPSPCLRPFASLRLCVRLFLSFYHSGSKKTADN
jgi:hypothetical protein